MLYHQSTIIFFAIFIISVFLDIILTPETRKCILVAEHNHLERMEIITHIIIHHFANTFLNFGWLIDNFWIHIVHIIICVGVIIYWANNNYRCDYTIYVNRLCKWHPDKYFNDIFEILGFKKYRTWHTIIHPAILLLGAGFSLSKI